MPCGDVSWDAASVVSSLERLADDCAHRKLNDANKWACEMLVSVASPSALASSSSRSPLDGLPTADARKLRFAYALFDSKEFLRAAELTSDWGRPKPRQSGSLLSFIHFYARYLAGEKDRLDTMADMLDKSQTIGNAELGPLLDELSALKTADPETFDHFHAYLLGEVCCGLGLSEKAESLFLQAVHAQPDFWPAWQRLATGIHSRDKLQQVSVPVGGWAWALWAVEAWLCVGSAEGVAAAVERLETASHPLADSDWVRGRAGAARHLDQDCEGARSLFAQLRERSPNRLEHMDDYANTLFVLAEKTDSARVELIALARHCAKVDKFCAITCFVLGNYYSMRSEHERAVESQQRAVKLEPGNAAAYILMGHEFMELKNTPAATLAYRQALQQNPKDCRAWYAMGTSYDLLQMPSYSAYYFLKAHQAQPGDSRFLIALGDMLLAKGNSADARACFWRAHCVGDPDGSALFKLGNAYEDVEGSDAKVATCYWTYLKQAQKSEDRDEESEAKCYLFLTQFAVGRAKWDAALTYAQCAVQYPLTKNRGKHFLQIASDEKKRAADTSGDVNMDDIKVE